MPKQMPTIGEPNWGTPLNAHLAQLQNPTNGGINSFEQFSGRPTTLTADDAGKTYLYTQTGNLHQWTGTTWKVLNESVINVKDYGAVGDFNQSTQTGTDNTAILQACLNLTNVPGNSKTVYLDIGNYKIASIINIPETASLIGNGQDSIITPFSCDAFNFLASNSTAPRQISNFTIWGNNGNVKTGFIIDLVPNTRVTGVTFSNLIFVSMDTGIRMYGLWHSTIRDCRSLHVPHPIIIRGRNIKITVYNCTFEKALAYSTNDKIAIDIQQFNGTRSEDIQIQNTLTFGFDIAIKAESVLYLAINNCDLDYCQKYGFWGLVLDGGFTLRDTWIASDQSSTFAYNGVYLGPLGTIGNLKNITIANNHITCANNTISSTSGVYIGSQQTNVTVDNNLISDFEVGVYVDASKYVNIIKNNISCRSTSIFLFSTSFNLISDNNLTQKIYTANEVTNIEYGRNIGVQTTSATNIITLPPNTTNLIVPLSTFGLPPVVIPYPSRHNPVVMFNNLGNNSIGNIWGSCDGANIIVNVTNQSTTAQNICFTLKVI